MDQQVLGILQYEVEFQCKCALTSASLMDQAYAADNYDGFWYALQGFLIAAANLSKLFWGSRGNKELERLDLRKSLGVTDDSPLRDPDLRNDFEHFDTRVEEWFAKSKDRNFFGRTIGPHSAVVGGGPVEERFQWYDPGTGVVTFLKHSVPLPAVKAAIIRIMPLVDRALHGPPLSERTCGTCGNLIPECTCLDAEGKPLDWGIKRPQ